MRNRSFSHRHDLPPLRRNLLEPQNPLCLPAEPGSEVSLSPSGCGIDPASKLGPVWGSMLASTRSWLEADLGSSLGSNSPPPAPGGAPIARPVHLHEEQPPRRSGLHEAARGFAGEPRGRRAGWRLPASAQARAQAREAQRRVAHARAVGRSVRALVGWSVRRRTAGWPQNSGMDATKSCRIGRNRPTSGRHRPEPSNPARFGRDWSEFLVWSLAVPVRSKSAQGGPFGATLVKFSLRSVHMLLAEVGRTGPISAQLGLDSTVVE